MCHTRCYWNAAKHGECGCWHWTLITAKTTARTSDSRAAQMIQYDLLICCACWPWQRNERESMHIAAKISAVLQTQGVSIYHQHCQEDGPGYLYLLNRRCAAESLTIDV